MAFSVSYTYKLLDRFSPAIKKITRNQQKFDQATKKAQQSLKKTSDRLQNFQSAIAGVGAAFVGYQVLDTFNRFETAMNKLSAVSMGTRTEMAKFRNMAIDLGASTRFTGAQVAEGMVYLRMAGLSTQEVLKATPGMLNLAAAGNISLGEASDLATNMLLQQGLAVEELTRVSDNLATVQTTSNTSILEAGDAMKNVLTTAAGLGFELEHTTALIGAMANVGLKGGEAGTLLRNALLRLVNPSRMARRAMRKLGISARDFVTPEGKIKNFNKLLSVLIKKGATTGDIFKIFQERGGRAMLALMRVGEKSITRLINLQEEGVRLGMAAEMARRQMAGIPGMILSFKSALEALQIAMVDLGLAKLLENIGKGLTIMIRKLTILHPNIVAFMGVFGALGIIVIGVTAAILILAPVFGALLSPVGAVILAVTTIVSLWAIFYNKSRKLREAWITLKVALMPIGDLWRGFMSLFGKENTTMIDVFATAMLGLAKAIGFLMKPLKWLTKKFIKPTLLEGVIPSERAYRAAGVRREFMEDVGERMRLSEMVDPWARGFLKRREEVIEEIEDIGADITKKSRETQINGTIEVKAAKGTTVESAELELTAPGSLGFNMAGS